MFEKSVSASKTSRNLKRLITLAAFLLASSRLCAGAAQSMPEVNAVTNAPSAFMLKESVSKSRLAKQKKYDGASLPKTNHLYYLVYTAEGQTARGDFAARKIFIAGERGSIVATDGLKVKVVSGKVHFINEGFSNLPIIIGADTTLLAPGQESTFGQSLANRSECAANETVSSSENIADKIEQAEHKHTKSSGALEPARVWAEANCQFGATSEGVIELLRGQVVVSSSQATEIHTLAGTVDCDPLSLVSVRCSESGLSVENASYFRPANVHSHGHTILVDGGHSVILVSGAPDAEKVPVDGVERRQLYACFDGYMTVLKSEFKMVSLIKRYRSLSLAMNSPISPFEKTLVDRWVKQIAIYSTIHGDPDDFSEKPQILAVTKLGQFFNPYCAN